MEPRSGDMELALVWLQTLQRLSAPNGPHIATLRSLWPVTVRWCEALVPASNRWILTIPSHGSRLPQLNWQLSGYGRESRFAPDTWISFNDYSVTRGERLVHGCTEGLFGHQERRASSRFSRGDRTILDCRQDLFGYEERKAGSRHLDYIQGLFGYKERRAGSWWLWRLFGYQERGLRWTWQSEGGSERASPSQKGRVFEPWVQPWNLGDFHSWWGCQGLEKRAGLAFGQHCWGLAV